MRMENEMETAMRKEIEELSRMTVGQLRQKYIEAFGEESRSNHKQFLFRRIAWRIQALAEGMNPRVAMFGPLTSFAVLRLKTCLLP